MTDVNDTATQDTHPDTANPFVTLIPTDALEHAEPGEPIVEIEVVAEPDSPAVSAPMTRRQRHMAALRKESGE